MEQVRKSWEQMDNAEKKESFDKYMKFKLFEAHKTGKADWQKDMSKEEVDNTIPYNAKTGNTYSRETNMLLRAEMAIKGYDKAQFVTMEQGNAMGGVLKLKHDEQTGEVVKTKNGKDARVDGVKMLYIADHELRPKLDKDGKEVTAVVKDKDGNVKYDQETGQPMTYVVKEKIPIKPRLETKTLYHVSQFDGLDESKIKERDLTAVTHYREQSKNQDFEAKISYGKTLGISGNLEKQLNNLTLAQIKGVDYYNPVQKVEMTKEKAQAKEQNKGIEQGR
ncbi:ArdC-like ssDNA-binding domain-containing protein [Campylobacter hyointestinalis]|uniref:ArdC-like ssDNA-binding domain-containing protein n=1 Tax=Campylobacter hyointestinalis TaxID=198 RepID=UPI00072A2D43|nr:ArdC-like ssDNA-binding domain-containing protein [Campylobacter hyointestinalis]CUU72748.1 Antirestriction protein [Campylobacter hyointestinalis subsp. hyointestinalis]